MSRLRALWWRVSGSLWFVPSFMVLGSIALAFALIEAEGAVGGELAQHYPRLFGAGAEGSREMLSAIAGSMITVAGVVFSVTLVALSLAASQYSPRVLRTFMSDKPTQVVLGVFVSVFAYCLIVLRTIRAEQEGSFVPSLAVLGGIAFALVAIGFLVFYIHHLATAMEVSTIITRISEGTLRTISQVCPQLLGEPSDGERQTTGETGRVREWTPVLARRSGYIVSVDYDGLVNYAKSRHRVLCMERAIGDFVVDGQVLAMLGGDEPLDDAATDELNALYSTDRQRTLEQDPGFGIQQIVDIAVRALSPGINDETTAIMCIDRLTEILLQLARRRLGPHWCREGRRPMVRTAAPDFAELARLCIDSIRGCAEGKPRVLLRLVHLVEQSASFVNQQDRAAVLHAYLDKIVDTAERTIPTVQDRSEIAAAAYRVSKRLHG